MSDTDKLKAQITGLKELVAAGVLTEEQFKEAVLQSCGSAMAGGGPAKARGGPAEGGDTIVTQEETKDKARRQVMARAKETIGTEEQIDICNSIRQLLADPAKFGGKWAGEMMDVLFKSCPGNDEGPIFHKWITDSKTGEIPPSLVVPKDGAHKDVIIMTRGRFWRKLCAVLSIMAVVERDDANVTKRLAPYTFEEKDLLCKDMCDMVLIPSTTVQGKNGQILGDALQKLGRDVNPKASGTTATESAPHGKASREREDSPSRPSKKKKDEERPTSLPAAWSKMKAKSKRALCFKWGWCHTCANEWQQATVGVSDNHDSHKQIKGKKK